MCLGFRKQWLLLLPIAALAVVVAFGLNTTLNSRPASAAPGNASMSIDAVASSTGTVEIITAPTGINDNATVAVTVDSADAPYNTYMWEISYVPTKLAYVAGSGTHLSPSGLSVCFAFSTGSFLPADPLFGQDYVNTTCGIAAGGTTSYTGQVDTAAFKCLAPGQQDLHLVTLVEDASYGTNVVGFTTALHDAKVDCKYLTDFVVTKTDNAPVQAGGNVVYTGTLTNNGPNASGVAAIPGTGLVVVDLMPVEKVVGGTTGVSLACLMDPTHAACTGMVPMPSGVVVTLNGSPAGVACVWFEAYNGAAFGFPWVYNLVLCDFSGYLLGGPQVIVPKNVAGTGVVVATITAAIPLSDADKYNVNAIMAGVLGSDDPDGSDIGCTGLPLPATPDNSVGCVMTHVDAALMTPHKSADKVQYSKGDTITWTVSATSGGPSPASNVVLSDNVALHDTNETLVSATLDVATAALYDCLEGTALKPDDAAITAGNTIATCTLVPDGQHGTGNPVTTAVPVGRTVGMNVVATVVDSAGNQCWNTGKVQWADHGASATIDKKVPCYPPTVRMQKDADTDPLTINDAANLWICEDNPLTPANECALNGEGSLTIYERAFNVKNDPDGAGSFEFQVKYDHKLFNVAVQGTDWLSNGINPMTGLPNRAVNCDLTIMTENWILFGCVSSGLTPGQKADGVMATITVTPTDDMVNRLTPGQDNGVYSPILDENCEISDVLGDPLTLDGTVLAPGVLPGGQIAVCSDIGITERILEGDLNLDCVVNVLDQQKIAFRYGSSFGMLLYNKWYDLEPAIKDFDIDIKDLQKVWGRDGSVCDGILGVGTIPPQPPMPFQSPPF